MERATDHSTLPEGVDPPSMGEKPPLYRFFDVHFRLKVQIIGFSNQQIIGFSNQQIIGFSSQLKYNDYTETSVFRLNLLIGEIYNFVNANDCKGRPFRQGCLDILLAIEELGDVANIPEGTIAAFEVRFKNIKEQTT